jgi:hypothetical protein
MKLLGGVLVLLFGLSVVGYADPVTVTAKETEGAPGAIVCGDMASVEAMLDSFKQNREAATERGPQGQSTLTNGDALEQPRTDKKGCALAKAGTRMSLFGVKKGTATVTFKLPDGRGFAGVTEEKMYIKDAGSKH